MAASTQPAFKTALKAALEARAALAAVQISWGFPKTPAKEVIVLGNIVGVQMPAAIGQLRREEAYKLEVLVKVEKQGTDQTPITLRAYELAAELEDELRTNPTVDGTVRVAQFGGQPGDPGRVNLEEYVTNEGQGRMSVLVIDVTCSARI